MKTKKEQLPVNNPNPVLTVENDGTVLYSNVAGEPLLYEWGVVVGEKLPSYIVDFVKRVISQNSPEKMEVKVGKRVYLVAFHPSPDEEFVNIYGFDISDQKELEGKLRESEKKYHLLFENMLDGFAYCRMLYDDCGHPVDFIYLDTNIAFEQLTGLKEVKGTMVTEAIPGIKELHPELFDAYSRVALTGKPERFEIEFKPLGTWLSMSVYSTEREHFVAIFDDITERKQADKKLLKAYEQIRIQSEELQVFNEELQVQSEELQETNEALQESEKRFRTLAENSPDMITRFDRRNRHTYANPAAAKVYGLSQEEIVGKTYGELRRDPEQVRFLETYYEIVFATGKPEAMEFQYTSPTGKEYYFNTKIVPEFVNGKVTSVLAISRDIKDLKEAETKLKETLDNLEELVKERTAELEKTYKSLKESERGLAEAQEMAHIGNWERNFATNQLYWSDEMYRIFGLKPQEFEVTYSIFLNYVHPDDQDYIDNAIKESLNGKPLDIDFRIILANREERTVHTKGEVVFDEKNNPVRIRGITQDITEHKKAEEAMAKIEIARKQEIHHRIKNNLQVISSLLDLQAEKFNNREDIKDSEVLEAFRESQDRVISMALIHEELYKGGGDRYT